VFGIKRLQPITYMAVGGLLVLGIQTAGGTLHPLGTPAVAAPSIALAAHNFAAARVRHQLLDGSITSNGIKIFQFKLLPSGLAGAFPQATGIVTVNGGNPAISLNDTVTVDVANMPPNVTFTIFYIELRTKPFGKAEYVSDLTTGPDGSGEVTFNCITFQAMALDGALPTVTSVDGAGAASGIQLNHMGLWFSDLKVAQQVLHNTALTATPFDGGSPPLHAGPQAMVDDDVNGQAF